MRHFVVRAVLRLREGDDARKMILFDHRIAEETPRAPDLCRIRQLLFPDADDGFADDLRDKASVFQRLTNATIVQDRVGDKGEAEGDGGDDVASFPGGLEVRGAVAVAAVGTGNVHETALPKVEGMDRVDDVLRLHAIGADVLHGAGAHLAGNQRQVLRTPESLRSGPGTEVVEDDAGAERNQNRFFAALSMTGVITQMHYGALIVSGEEQVRAAAHHENGLREGVEIQRKQVLRLRDLHIQTAGHLHAEGVPPGKVIFVVPSDHPARGLVHRIYITISINYFRNAPYQRGRKNGRLGTGSFTKY